MPRKSLHLLLVLTLHSTIFAEQLPVIREGLKTVPAGRALKVVVLDGDGAVNYLPSGNAVPPVVEVRDENDMPVEGAEVTFELPGSGPSGMFESGGRTHTVRTDARGQVGAGAIHINNIAGRLPIKVSAAYNGLMASSLVVQTSSSTPGRVTGAGNKPGSGWSKKKIYIVVGCAAAAALAGGIYALGHGAPPTISVTPGPPVFSSPR
jgi:hypothetical protein